MWRPIEGDIDKPPNPQPGYVELSSETKVLDSTTTSQINSVSPDKSTITISGSTPQTEGLSVGDIIMGSGAAAPDGMLRKIVSISKDDNGNTVIKTEQAALTDAITNASISLSGTIGEDDIESITSDYLVNTPLERDSEATRAKPGSAQFTRTFKIPIDTGVDETIAITGKINYDLSKLEIEYSGLKSMLFTATFSVKANNTLSSTAKAEFNFNKPLATITCKPISIPVGLILPLIVRPVIHLNFAMNGNIEAASELVGVELVGVESLFLTIMIILR